MLGAVELRALAEELLGAHAGSDRSPTWPCPNPGHPQTGRTPPLTIFTAWSGEQRWHCHGCGNGGTAIDLVMQVRGLEVRGALDFLARRSGLPVADLTGPAAPRGDRPRRPGRVDGPQPPRAVPGLERYVAECEAALWRSAGEPIRRWLTDARGLPEDLLRLHRLGADLGARHQWRPDGLPQVRRAAVLPVLVDGMVCYAQLRVLGGHRRGPKYLNPAGELAANPRLGFYGPASSVEFPFPRRELIVGEGVIDALSAAAGGYRAAAVLGASYADPGAAVGLVRRPEPLVVAFDPDPAGRAGAERLVRFLAAHHRTPGVLVLRGGDLNDHLVKSLDWPVELAGRVQHATARPGLMPSRGAPPALGL